MAVIPLTNGESNMLVLIATEPGRQLTREKHKPNMRVVNSLIAKGLAEDAGDSVWRITEAGRERSTSIY